MNGSVVELRSDLELELLQPRLEFFPVDGRRTDYLLPVYYKISSRIKVTTTTSLSCSKSLLDLCLSAVVVVPQLL